jgi:hypothetical protein
MAHEGVPLVVIQRQLGHYAGDRVKRLVQSVGNGRSCATSFPARSTIARVAGISAL